MLFLHDIRWFKEEEEEEDKSGGHNKQPRVTMATTRDHEGPGAITGNHGQI